MKSKFYLFAGLSVLALSAGAQRLQTEYITWPDGQKLGDQVKAWNGSQLMEDENFFISRVKIKPYINRNTNTQVFESINDNNDKKSLFWVPVGNVNLKGVHTDALPNGIFDSEVFSMWPYVTHYGDWTAPYGWVPAALADAAHKHGTAVSGEASVPNATIPTAWANAFTSIGSCDPDKVGQFLLYHGVDGLGYNSEWYGGSAVQAGLNKIHAGLMKFMEGKNDKFENIWYTGTEDSGTVNGFYDGLYNGNKTLFGDKDNKRTSLFLNYNWNSSSKISTSRTTANQLGRDMRDLYAGMNMQGGCKTSTEWTGLFDIEYSIGFWGAHDFNYLWSPRSQSGSSSLSKQKTYQRLCEWWYSNGKRNPVVKLPVRQNRNLGSSETFHGVSRYVSARSTLGWDLETEPFISYFNLGNGTFFNWEGERQNDNEWYVLGIQDYMPTWRFWFSTKLLGKDEADVPANGLDAEFTWEDAWFGGSSLRIFGSTPQEYLHLFKTDFQLARNYAITVRYKLIAGKADINLVLSDGTTAIAESDLAITTTEKCDPDDETWVVKTFNVTQRLASLLTKDNIAMIGLKFANAENLDMYLGEISIRPKDSFVTPVAPEITLAKVLANNYQGVDAKIIFNMPNNKPAMEPCYNIDVNTSLFRIWAQQEGGEPMTMGATTSWAAMVYAFPKDETSNKVRFGVQAVSVDFQSASEITWSDYMDCGDYKKSNEILCDKNTIKPGEQFTVKFVDPMHESGAWKLIDATGKEVYSTTGTSFTTKLDELGSYNLTVDGTEYPSYITITAWDKGALPEILTLTVNDEEAGEEAVSIKVGDEITLGYTGRESDGKASQAIEVAERFVGFPMKNVGLEGNNSFAVGAWLKFNYPVNGTRLHGVEDRTGSWPQNNWGWVWSNMNEDGSFFVTFRTNRTNGGNVEIRYTYNEKFNNNTWTHILFGYEWKNGQFRLRTFMNGKEILPSALHELVGGAVKKDVTNLTDPENFWLANGQPVTQNDWFYFGGGAGSEPVYNNGVVDDLVVFTGAVTEADALKAYEGLKESSLPSNVRCFWSFESKANDDNAFPSVGSVTGIPASNFALLAGDNEGQATQTPIPPTYNSGCPTLDGEFEITSVPTWTAKRAVISEQSGSHTEGKAKLSYARKGDYRVALTLTNSLGSHTKEYPVISVAPVEVSIEGVENVDNAEVYTVDDAIFVAVGEAGNYTVAVYDVTGKTVAQRSASLEGGEYMSLNVRQNGVYLVQIACNGKVVRTVKVVKN